jgi:hypothetical protein
MSPLTYVKTEGIVTTLVTEESYVNPHVPLQILYSKSLPVTVTLTEVSGVYDESILGTVHTI